MRLPFRSQAPSREAELFAEAQALLDDGLDAEFVLGLYPDDADWLGRLIGTSQVIGGTYAAEEPSYYFEASLKSRFMEAAGARDHAPAPVYAAPSAFASFRTALASVGVVAAVAAFGVVTFGYATSGDSVPGDWNYAFKRAGERVEYSLARGDGRIDVQIEHAEARIEEIQRLTSSGDLSPTHVKNLVRELDNLKELASENQFNDVQRARVNGLAESTVALLADPPPSATDGRVADEAITRAAEVVAAAAGTPVGSLPTPTATPTETATPAETPTPTETATPSPTPEPTVEPSASPAPTESATVEATASETGEAAAQATATETP